MAEIINIPEEELQFVEDIFLDFNQEFKTTYPIKIPQYDTNSRYIRATLTVNGEPYIVNSSQIVTFSGTKPDKFGIDNPAKIDSQGRIVYEITEQTTNYPGTFEACFTVYDTKTVSGVTITRRKTPFNFKIYIVESPLQDSTIISTNEFKVLTDLIATVGDIITDASALMLNMTNLISTGNDLIDSMTTLENAVESAEEGRAERDSTRPIWLEKTWAQYNSLTQEEKDDLLYFYTITDSESSDDLVDELQNLIDDTNTARLAAEQIVISQNNINDGAINSVQTWSSSQISQLLPKYKKIVTSSTVSSVTHNLNYNPVTDYLEVIYNGLILTEGTTEEYTSSADFKTINLTSWTIPSGKIVQFILHKYAKL